LQDHNNNYRLKVAKDLANLPDHPNAGNTGAMALQTTRR
jgi:hypothetical protein